MRTDHDEAGQAHYTWLVAAVLAAVTLQAMVAARSPVIAKDGIGFIRIAQQLDRDAGAAFRLEDQHPGYPAMILAGARAARLLSRQDDFGAWIAGGRCASALAGALGVVVVWLLARRLFDRRVAGVAAILFAVLPLLRQNASDVLSDTPHLLFYLAAAWLACEGLVRGGARWFAAAGLASGLAYWIRPEGLSAAAVAGAVLVAGQARRRRLPAAKVALCLGALGLATLTVTAPYVLIAGKLTSKKNPFAPPLNTPVADGDSSPTAGLLAEPAPGATLPDERPRPASWLARSGAALVELGDELCQGFRYVLLLPLALGHFAPGRPRGQTMPVVLLIALGFCQIALLLILYHTSGYISHRHVIPLVAIWLPCTAAGTVWLADQLHALAGGPDRPRWALAAVVVVLVAVVVPKSLRPLHQNYYPLVAAARWVKAHARPGDAVLSTSSYVRFYAHLEGLLVGLEVPNLKAALAHPREEGAWPFLVLEVDTRSFDRRQVSAPGADYEQVVELAAHFRNPWSKVLVYQDKRRAGCCVAVRDNPCVAAH